VYFDVDRSMDATLASVTRQPEERERQGQQK
jgi:hypothetical protein